jgi:hypothetical protein
MPITNYKLRAKGKSVPPISCQSYFQRVGDRLQFVAPVTQKTISMKSFYFGDKLPYQPINKIPAKSVTMRTKQKINGHAKAISQLPTIYNSPIIKNKAFNERGSLNENLYITLQGKMRQTMRLYGYNDEFIDEKMKNTFLWASIKNNQQ